MEKAKLWLYENSYKKAQNHPDKTGTGEITKDVIAKLIERAKTTDGDTVKIQCAGWNRVSKNGNSYLFITLETEERAQGQKDDKPKAANAAQDLPW